ncbi:hypothetical protein BC828DRAFT_232794 [Blastocladiella britannica]|nr:hypothetical protein BC828DRAFT_232794 [Blastocladiella britannica]
MMPAPHHHQPPVPAGPPKPRLRVQLHWNELPTGRAPVPLEKTIWHADEDEDPVVMMRSTSADSGAPSADTEPSESSTELGPAANKIAFDLQRFEDLFCVSDTPAAKRGAAAGGAGASAGASKKPEAKLILDMKRVNNVDIALTAKFGRGENVLDNIPAALLTLDTKALNSELVAAIAGILPTEEEQKQLGRVTAKEATALTRPERFMWNLMQIPSVEYVINCWQLMDTVDPELKRLDVEFTSVADTCQKLRTHAGFKVLLRSILSLANLANSEYGRRPGPYGVAKPAAAGFRLDVLPKLRDVKSADGKVTLLHYLVDMLSTGMPEILGLPSEFGALKALRHISTPDLLAELSKLTNDLTMARNHHALTAAGTPVAFKMRMQEFLVHAEAKLAATTTSKKHMWEEWLAVAHYFGEDPETTNSFVTVVARQPEDLFKILELFLTYFSEAVRETEARRERERKAAERERVRQASALAASAPNLASDNDKGEKTGPNGLKRVSQPPSLRRRNSTAGSVHEVSLRSVVGRRIPGQDDDDAPAMGRINPPLSRHGVDAELLQQGARQLRRTESLGNLRGIDRRATAAEKTASPLREEAVAIARAQRAVLAVCDRCEMAKAECECAIGGSSESASPRALGASSDASP